MQRSTSTDFGDQVVPEPQYPAKTDTSDIEEEEADFIPILHWSEVAVLFNELDMEEITVVSCNKFSRVAVEGYLKFCRFSIY